MSTSPAKYFGTQFDRRYRIDRLIGEGASAWVFAAHDLRLDRDVALKLLKPLPPAEQIGARRRFADEGRTLAKLLHPHVVAVHDVGETPDGLCYLVMELSTSGTLESALELRGTLAVAECVGLLLPLMGALACAHDRNIIHRDIKPANIALAGDSASTLAKLLDFGIAWRSDSGCTTDSARGTPSYMAPEQVRGEQLTPSVDVWALGVVMFRCLSGRLPFVAQSSFQTALKLVRERAPRFAAACPGLGPRLALVLDRTLEPEVQERYSDMRALARAITMACVHDNVPLPREPDPVGLADFAVWASTAAEGRTGRITFDERGRLPIASLVEVPRRATHRKLGVWLASSLPIVSVAGIWLAHVGSDKQTNEPRATTQQLPDGGPGTQPPGAMTSTVPPAAVPSAEPPKELFRTVVQTNTKRPHARSAHRVTRRAPTPEENAHDVTTSEQPGLVTTWDW